MYPVQSVHAPLIRRFDIGKARAGITVGRINVIGSFPPISRRLADESYELLRRDPKHPSLHFKRLGRFWSVRVGLHYRALAVEHENRMVWL